MSKDKIADYDGSTAGNNTDIGGISIAEGMLPSAVNNSMRELTKQLGAFSDGTDGIDVLNLHDDDASASIKIQAPSAVTTTTTLTLPDGDGDAGAMLQTNGSGQLAWSTAYRNRNLIINGAMQVAQRGTSSTSSGKHTCDRWTVNFQAFDQLAVTQSQSTTTPSGFSNSLKVEVTTAETALAADELMYVSYRIEAQDLQHLNYGGSGAKAVTLSFWVRSSLTGKYSVLLYQDDATRSNTKSFNITSANTWEYKTITIDGDTAGTIDNNNDAGLSLYITLAAGADFSGTPHSGWGAYTATDDFSFSDNVDFTAQTGTFYITSVQLEIGEQATPFEHLSFGEELQLCKRYFQVHDDMQLRGNPDGGFERIEIYCPLGVSMRANPSRAVITEGNSTNIRSSTTTYSGFVLANRTAGCTLSLESNSAGLASFDNRTESLDAEL
jgi:hypothetical protein